MILACRSFSVRRVAIGMAVSFALLSCAANAAAQASRVGATLEGVVRDTSGAVISNSKVTLHNPLTNQSRTVTTDEQGFLIVKKNNCYRSLALRPICASRRKVNSREPRAETGEPVNQSS